VYLISNRCLHIWHWSFVNQ